MTQEDYLNKYRKNYRRYKKKYLALAHSITSAREEIPKFEEDEDYSDEFVHGMKYILQLILDYDERCEELRYEDEEREIFGT